MRMDIEQIQRLFSLLTCGCLLGFCLVATRAAFAENIVNTGYILHIQMTPAVCSLDSARKKQRKCLEGYALTVAGLMPETLHNRCETNTSAILSPLQAKVVARILPDEAERIQLWKSIGGCVPMSAAQYFRTIVNYAQELKIPTVMNDPSSHLMSKAALIQQISRLNPRLPIDGMVLTCQSNHKATLLTHVSICYKNNGDYKSCTTKLVSNCPSNLTIQGIY
ncbi:ribonuclease I [Acinetobacter sp. MD2]|uniref:ribonuclease T2 family protein n=1 Tax=Acinetobacter sp. MD2 TaxID=2600066 RepID=UPI002D1EAA2D|nr:ribonuclease I [Acinetobacter sp. MD2]MEB3767101.1 ribonuclease I [Acinetobacter sp. MD2]